MKIRNRFLAVALATTAILAVSAQSQAATVLIQGVVYFGAGTPVTDYSKPRSQVAFSFDVPEVLGGTYTTDVTDFSYDLNGVAVTTPVEAVEFYTVANEGMFDIFFGDHTVSIYGADIGSSGTIGPAGFYNVTAGIDEKFPGTGIGGVTVNAPSVPEPATWAVMLVGFGGIGMAMRARRKTAIAA
jgi:opacity protein-like surface antigen